MSATARQAIRPKPNLKPTGRPSRVPIATHQSNTELNKKLAHMAELHNGLEILKGRMSQAKQELLLYFDKNPALKSNKYPVGNRFIRYVDRKSTGGMSQRLVLRGLTEYFRATGEANVENKVAEAMSTILAQRVAKVVPTIDITKQGQLASMSEDGEGSDEEI